MIFVTVGTQKFPFDRLLSAVDQLDTEEEIFAQTGHAAYVPRHYPYKAFLTREEMDDCISRADIVITHGGTGSIISAVRKGKKVIAVPRLSAFGEHVDDHQLQFVRKFAEMNYIYACEDMDIRRALEVCKNTGFRVFHTNTQAIIDSIERFIGQ